MNKYMIHHNDENYITFSEAATLTVGDIIKEAKRFPDTVFTVCKTRDGDYVTGYDMGIRFYGVDDGGIGVIGYEFELLSSRKFDEGIPEVETLHDELGEVILENGCNHGVAHELPTRFMTLAAASYADFKHGDKLDKIVGFLINKAQKIYDEALDRAINSNITKLNLLKELRKRNREEEAN